MHPTRLGAYGRPMPRSLSFRHQPIHDFREVARACSLPRAVLRSTVGLLSALCLVMISQTPAIAAEAQTNRIRIQYFAPVDPTLQNIYELIKGRQSLEKLQIIFSPFRLPMDLTIKTGDCGGVSNAWYERPAPDQVAISICYEYVNEILHSMPKETTPEGITPADAAIGQFFYIVAHEMGHAVFDVLGVPIFGNAEDAADHFSTYIMLQSGKKQSRALIGGAAYSYHKYLQNSQVTAPLAAFSDVHAPPAQRFFNLVCLAYGADPVLFADVVEKGHLSKDRAKNCSKEYEQVALAFRDLIIPHLDVQLAKQVLDRTWLPDLEAGPAKK